MDPGDEITALLRGMRRGNASENTTLTYGTACRLFAEWMVANGYPTNVDETTARHAEAWDRAPRACGDGDRPQPPPRAAAVLFLARRTARRRLALPDGKDAPASARPPHARVLTLDELRAVLGSCAGKGLEDRRDEALIRMFFNTGARRGEIGGLQYSPTGPADRDVNLARGTARVFGKGRKERLAEIDDLYPHDLRHAWRHHAEQAGASRETLMALGGWESDAMLRSYASTTANERAIEQARKIALGDKL
jgi:integrase